MHRILKLRRAEIKQYRHDRDGLKTEKADLYHKALDVNVQIAAKREELSKLYDKRSEKTKEIDKLVADRADIGLKINEKRQEINTCKATKKTIFDACRVKKSQIMEKDRAIMKAQDDIKSIKGSHKDI